MFDFFNELFKGIKKGAYRYQVDSSGQIAVEGFKTVLKVEETCIVLKLDGGELEITGKNLKVREITTNTIKICGKICGVFEVQNGK